MEILVERFDSSRREDFFSLHCEENKAGWCRCVGWWVPTWEGFGERTTEENQRLREELLGRGEYDGYLLYADGRPVGWCQAGPRDRLEKLQTQFGLEPDPTTWAVTCFLVAPDYRKKGLTRRLLAEVLVDLKARGARRVEAFPRRPQAGEELDVLDQWTGPEAMFAEAGFSVVKDDDPKRVVLALELD